MNIKHANQKAEQESHGNFKAEDVLNLFLKKGHRFMNSLTTHKNNLTPVDTGSFTNLNCVLKATSHSTDNLSFVCKQQFSCKATRL